MFDDFNFAAADIELFVRVALRLVVACALGAVIGMEREARGRAAGLRTHILVALGAALFTALPVEINGLGDLAAVVRGVAPGVGFLGAGAILKRKDVNQVSGMTTASGIWATAAMGVAVGAGWLAVAALVTGLTWGILRLLAIFEERNEPHVTHGP